MLIYYLNIGDIQDRNKIVVDNIFALNITRNNNGKFEPQTSKNVDVEMIGQCRIQIELNS